MGERGFTHGVASQGFADCVLYFMKLAKLLSADQILLDMQAVDHWPAITELVDHLVRIERLAPGQREPILEALKVRENLVSTGIGCGVAIPHVFSDAIEQVVAVLGCSKAGLDFEAIDQAPVHFIILFIILFIVPHKDYHLHLRTLAAIAKMFTNRAIRRQLKAAETRDEILAIFNSNPSRVAAPGT
jgi:mannitol/fructose-specific phosphotransferase system IIA component (Ntr-type)